MKRFMKMKIQLRKMTRYNTLISPKVQEKLCWACKSILAIEYLK